MLTESQYIKKYLLNKNVYSPSMMAVIESEINKLKYTKLNKTQQKRFDRLLYESNTWKLINATQS